MATRRIISAQIGLSIFRFVMLSPTLGALLFILSRHWGDLNRMPGSFLAQFIIIILGCFNDLVICIWDIYTHGSIFATVIWQICISVAILIALSLHIADWAKEGIFVDINYGTPDHPYIKIYWQVIAPSCPIIASIISLGLVILTARAWSRGIEGSWKRGVKDTRSLKYPWLSILGNCRSEDDSVRKMAKSLLPWLLQCFTRRIESVESLRFAIMRNITAIILLCILVARGGQLFYGVVTESFEVREISAPFLRTYNINNVDIMYENHGLSRLSTPPVSLTLVIRAIGCPLDKLLTYCKPTGSIVVGLSYAQACSRDGNAICNASSSEQQVDVVDSDVTLETVMASPDNSGSQPATPERIWWITDYGKEDDDVDQEVTHLEAVLQHSPGIRLPPGFHLFGLLHITERRYIKISFLEMIGFYPSYTIIPLLSPIWINSIPLNDTIARATLRMEWPSRPLDHPPQHNVIQDFRQNTFLSALASLGGLLAVIQGLHVLCFGRPLFWALLGSKSMDPFGLFGTFSSKKQKEAIRKRYDFTPGSGLAMFLDDFLVDFGPLVKKSDMADTEDTEHANADGFDSCMPSAPEHIDLPLTAAHAHSASPTIHQSDETSSDP